MRNILNGNGVIPKRNHQKKRTKMEDHSELMSIITNIAFFGEVRSAFVKPRAFLHEKCGVLTY
ncbi:MAG: hypothetical protein O7C70_04655 [Candidatus Dadabacteria bacterium]|nr:hypothetical protein [Candidatus Dadabacteria bacterium]